jgi:uncharacterized OB-fold protein
VSFAVLHRPLHPAFDGEAPILLAEIRLTVGVSLLARVVGVPADALAVGSPVRLVQGTEAARYPLPTFTVSGGI